MLGNRKVWLLFLFTIVLRLGYFFVAYYSEGSIADISIFKRNDAYWYQEIATNGHDKITPEELGKCEEGNLEQSYYAFFPLYPMLVGVVMRSFNLSFDVAAFSLSLIVLLLMVETMYRCIEYEVKSQRVAFWTTALVLSFPFSFYFSMFYTESLFLLLFGNAWWAARQRKLYHLMFFASLLVLVRPNGFFLLPILFLVQFEDALHWHWRPQVKEILRLINGSLIYLVPIGVFVVYCIYLYTMTGDFFAYKTAQAGWCRETVFPWIPILNTDTFSEWLHLIYSTVVLTFVEINYRKLKLSHIAFIGIGLLLPLMANSIPSPRFISVLFVVPMFLAMNINDWNKYSKICFLIGLLVTHYWSFTFWLNSDIVAY